METPILANEKMYMEIFGLNLCFTKEHSKKIFIDIYTLIEEELKEYKILSETNPIYENIYLQKCIQKNNFALSLETHIFRNEYKNLIGKQELERKTFLENCKINIDTRI